MLTLPQPFTFCFRHCFGPGLALAGALALSACGQAVQPQTALVSGCDADAAQIGVYDGYLQILCGCSESSWAPVGANSELRCTIPTGRSVIFQFPGVRLRHQILSTGSPSFVSSPVIDPTVANGPRTHGVQFTVSGQYTFQNAFNSTQLGRIIVQ